jgi:hypothetical protein
MMTTGYPASCTCPLAGDACDPDHPYCPHFHAITDRASRRERE